MEKEFVPYPIAIRMKQLGFDNVPCLAVWYNVPELDDYDFFDFSNHFSHQHYETQYYANKGFKDAVLAPTWHSAFAWFRDKHDLRAWVQWGSEYLCLGQIQYSSGLIECISHGSTDEEANLACLKKLIEIVEKKKEDGGKL